MPNRQKTVEYKVDPETKRFTTTLNGHFEKMWFDENSEAHFEDDDIVYVVNGEVVPAGEVQKRIQQIAWGDSSVKIEPDNRTEAELLQDAWTHGGDWEREMEDLLDLSRGGSSRFPSIEAQLDYVKASALVDIAISLRAICEK